MGVIKNLKEGTNSLSDLISLKRNQILSKGLTSSENCDLRLFSIPEDEMIRNESYPMEVIYLCLKGEIRVTKNSKDYILKENDFLSVNIGDVSSLYADEDSVLLQMMVKE